MLISSADRLGSVDGCEESVSYEKQRLWWTMTLGGKHGDALTAILAPAATYLVELKSAGGSSHGPLVRTAQTKWRVKLLRLGKMKTVA